MPDDDYARRPNGVIASVDYGIFNVFMRVSVSALRVGGYRVEAMRRRIVGGGGGGGGGALLGL